MLKATKAPQVGLYTTELTDPFTLWKDRTPVQVPGCTHTQHTPHTWLQAPSMVFLLASYQYLHLRAQLDWWVGVVAPSHQSWPAQHTLPHHRNSFCICTAASLTPEAHAQHLQHPADWETKGIFKLQKIPLCDMSKTLLTVLLSTILNWRTNLSSYNQKWLSLPT